MGKLKLVLSAKKPPWDAEKKSYKLIPLYGTVARRLEADMAIAEMEGDKQNLLGCCYSEQESYRINENGCWKDIFELQEIPDELQGLVRNYERMVLCSLRDYYRWS